MSDAIDVWQVVALLSLGVNVAAGFPFLRSWCKDFGEYLERGKENKRRHDLEKTKRRLKHRETLTRIKDSRRRSDVKQTKLEITRTNPRRNTRGGGTPDAEPPAKD